MISNIHLQIDSAGEKLEPIFLPSGVHILGRHKDCDIVVPDPHASRRQLSFEVQDNGVCLLADLGSKNPVRLNNEVVSKATLKKGDQIEVGDTLIEICAETEDESTKAHAESQALADATKIVSAPEAAQVYGEGESGTQLELIHDGNSTESVRVALHVDTVHSALQPVEGAGQHSQRKLDGLYKIAELIAQAPDADQFLERALEVLFESLPAERGFVALGSSESGGFHAVKLKSNRRDEGSAIQMSQTILDEIQLERKALFVQDAPSELAFNGAQSILRLGIRSFLCAPMVIDDSFVGYLYLDQQGEKLPFQEADLSYLQGAANLCAIALKNLSYRERLRSENKNLRSILERKNQIVAKTEPMVEILRKVARMAEREASVLVTGETGTGKEVIARAIHDCSPRKDKPFVAFNCSLSNPSLIESELFGHCKGAFTDASRDHKGKFELANGGTLFLDEIGDMPLATQVKMLRAIQEKCIEPVGSEKSIQVDIRLIAATHRNLEEMRENKEFREDLFYRIAVLSLELPPLRDRGEDILEIAAALCPGVSIEAAAQKALLAYAWPGNVRELQNIMEQAAFNALDDCIRLKDLPVQVASQGRKPRIEIPLTNLAEMEAKHIRKVLKACKGNKKRSSEILGISRETLYQKLKLYGISSTNL